MVRIAAVGSGEYWTTYGLCDEQGHCRIIQEFCELRGVDARQAKKMMKLLKGRAVAGNLGPLDLPDYMSEHLEDDIFQFKRGPKTGGGIRVLFFYPSNRQKSVICTHSFIKRTKKTPPGEIDAAKASCSAYYVAAEARRIMVVPLIPEFPQGVN